MFCCVLGKQGEVVVMPSLRKEAERAVAWFSQGTAACAIAMNWGDLTNAVDPAVLQEASKTGVTLAMIAAVVQKVMSRGTAKV